LFLPHDLLKEVVRDFSGVDLVISEKSYHTMNLLEGVVGLYFLIAIDTKLKGNSNKR
jgi:hypothetical protein